jgi:hypothetical protein
MKKATKSFCQRIWLLKPESERTKTQKAIRDVAFFAVVIYAAVISFLYFDAEAQIIELDCGNVGQVSTQVALNK